MVIKNLNGNLYGEGKGKMVQKDLIREQNAEVLHRLKAEMRGILVDRPVMIAYLYGSALDGSQLPTSDVDIGLVLDPNDLLSP